MTAARDRALEVYLPAEGASVGRARAAVDALAELHPHPDARFAVRLLVSELVTNAVRYGSDGGALPVRLALTISSALVRAEVADRGDGFDPETVAMPHVDAESGRGLAFLDALASRWGVLRNGGNCVWFEIDLGAG